MISMHHILDCVLTITKVLSLPPDVRYAVLGQQLAIRSNNIK